MTKKPKIQFNYDGFKLIAQAKEEDLLEFLGPQITELYGKDNVDVNKDYIFARGDLPVLLVAHLDTVHKTIPRQIYYDVEQGIIWSPDGIGGDDRCGVYGLLVISTYCRKNFKKMPSLLFTTKEEVGCIGAGIAANKVSDSFVSRINFAIELDRRGKNDCVFYGCNNKEFRKMIESHDFVYANGSFSDIGKICPAWDIAGVNLSIGYDNEHTSSETVNVNWLISTIDRTIDIVLSSPSLPKYEYDGLYSTGGYKKPPKNHRQKSMYDDEYADDELAKHRGVHDYGYDFRSTKK